MVKLIVPILCFLFLLSGLILLNWEAVKKFGNRILYPTQKSTLKDRLDILTGRINKHRVKRELHEVKQTLSSTGNANKYGLVRILSVSFCILGIAIAMIMKNSFLFPIFATVGAILPFIYIKSITAVYRRKINSDLEDALFSITYSYLVSDNFVSVVKDNLDLLTPTMRPIFNQFVTQSTLIDADVTTGINNLKIKINHPIFHQWCDCVTQSQTDSTIKGNLLSIVEQFSDNHIIQYEVATLIAGARRNALHILAMTAFFPLLIKVLNPEWFAIYSTFQGKFSIAFSIVIILFATYRIMKLSRPTEMEEGK